ncbi:MAG: hypothetical protein HFH93_12625 [Lachnospiraceae bacterium]|nr:hypothetical protein [Lachnospiraceae bacterium]
MGGGTSDMCGRRFGSLTVISYDGRRGGKHYWKCLCSCGKETSVSHSNLINSHTQSCGCMASPLNTMHFVDGTCIERIRSRKTYASNKSGVRGVYWNERTRSWVAQITFQGKTKYLGSYAEFADAAKARASGEKLFDDFLEKHGSGIEKKRDRKMVICFKLLGSFAYTTAPEKNTNSIDETGTSGHQEREYGTGPGKAGKKTLSFLQYLIVNHSRNITAEELIDVFWTEKDSNDPANALRNMLFKIRSLLKNMFPEQDDLFRTFPGCYAWNPQTEIELDTECFEKVCLGARQESGEKSLTMLRQAVALYHGDFLSGNDSEWARDQRQYYRTLYLDACKTLLPLLEEREEWMEIVSVCSQAYQIDFCVEEFTTYQMQAFISMGQPEQAVDRYDAFHRQMLKELGMPPTERIEQLYTLALGLRKEDRGDDKEIFKLVSRGNPENKAFFCSFGTFQSIVALEKRHLARSGQCSTLVIVSLGKDGTPTTDIRRLERIIMGGLRTGDPVARLEAGSYIVMLTGADAENAQIVTSRLDSAFHKTYRHSNAQLSFKMSQLCPEENGN